MQRLLRLVLALSLLGGSGAFAAEQLAIHEYVLDNGLRLIVRPDRRAPVVVSQVWYKVGSSYEQRGITGVSHVLEHMMFKGTKKYPPGEFSRIIAMQGGRENAFTGRDYTAYFQQLAADRLPIAFELEADRMQNLQLREEDFTKELQVVIEERRLRTEDNPVALAMERYNTIAYPISPYRNPIIGWMGDLRDMRLAELQSWYEQWYTPSNALIVVAGDVDPKAVLDLARKYFGPIPARPAASPEPPLELEGPGQRRITQKLPAELPYFSVGYQVPSEATAKEPWVPYALMVLSGVLDGGESARLPSELVRGQEVAAGISADYSMVARLDGLFSFAGYPARGKDLPTLEKAVLAQIERLQTSEVSAEELERAKNQIVADHLYQLDSLFYQAMQIGLLETAGIGWKSLADFEARVRAVTAAQLQAVAKQYLIEDRQAILHLLPVKQGGQP